MPILVVCPKCGTKLNAPDQAAGKRIRCKCGEAVGVPGPGAASAPASPAKPSAAAAKPAAASGAAMKASDSLFDVLTDRDLQQAPVNPYAPVEKGTNTDAAALRTYLRNDDEEKERANQHKTNLTLVTVGFILSFLKSLFAVVAFFALLDQLGQAAQAMPYIRVGKQYLVLLGLYVVFDLLAAVGLILRKPWGWWLAVIGIGWVVVERWVAFGFSMMMSEDITYALGVGLGSLVVTGIAVAFLNVLMQDETQKIFKVDVSSALTWAVAILVPLVIEGGFAAYAYPALKQAMSAIRP